MASSARPLAPPRAAAIAGVIFSLLLSITIVISRLAVPPVQTDSGEWLMDPVRRNVARFAIQLAPFSGIAFLWFLGVIRNRLGVLEDQFFATVFFGSGLLFVANLFVSAALAGALLEGVAQGQSGLLHSETYHLIRQIIGASMNIFAVKMAGVFMVSTSTIVTRTGILPRWVAYSGFACAACLLVLLVGRGSCSIFPLLDNGSQHCICADGIPNHTPECEPKGRRTPRCHPTPTLSDSWYRL